VSKTLSGKIKGFLDWVQRGYLLVQILTALGAGKLIEAVLRTQTKLSSVWIAPISLLSSAIVLALLVVFVNAHLIVDKLDKLNADAKNSLDRALDDLKTLDAKGAAVVSQAVAGLRVNGECKKLHALLLSQRVLMKVGEYRDFGEGELERIHLELLDLPDDHHAKVRVDHPVLGMDFALGQKVLRDGQYLILPKSDLGLPSVSVCVFMPLGEMAFHLFSIWLYHANIHSKEATVFVDAVWVRKNLTGLPATSE
jgi:hypothetical protein